MSSRYLVLQEECFFYDRQYPSLGDGRDGNTVVQPGCSEKWVWILGGQVDRHLKGLSVWVERILFEANSLNTPMRLVKTWCLCMHSCHFL